MRKTILLLATMLVAVLAAAGVALALPSETPDNTPMVDGPVRAIAQSGNNVWVGGNFNKVQQRGGALIANTPNIAVFNATTGEYRDIAPTLGGSGAIVRGIATYGGNVVIGGIFTGPSGAQKNLVMVDGATGQVVRWYNAPTLQSVLAAPGLDRIYGGGKSLSAFDAATGQRLWTRAETTVDPDLRTHSTVAGYRDLELDGQSIWAACACDTVAGNPSKALVKLSTEGTHDASWMLDGRSGFAAFGISVVQQGGQLYLGAGGNDFLAQYSKTNGTRGWNRDTSGSTQVVEVMDGKLVVGGHFWEVADHPADRCGFRSKNNNATLDPRDECHTRHGLAAYSFSGTLDPNWSPMLGGRYNLAWSLQPDTLVPDRLHVGGDYTTVNGVSQRFYSRLSPVSSLRDGDRLGDDVRKARHTREVAGKPARASAATDTRVRSAGKAGDRPGKSERTGRSER